MILLLVLFLSTSLLAQETTKGSPSVGKHGEVKKMKVCVKTDENKNGAVTQIDTCFESTDPAEVHAFLERMGMDAHVRMFHDKNGAHPEGDVIIMRHHEMIQGEGENGEKITIPLPEGALEDHLVIEIDENGKVIRHGGDEKIIIKEFDGDIDALEQEIEILMEDIEKQTGLEPGEKGVKKEIRVFVARKMEINPLSDEERKNLPESIKTRKGKSFESLEISPNPTRDIVNISYKNNSSEPLKLKLYNAAGQLLIEEINSSPDKEMNQRLDLSPLEKGVYFLHLEQGKKSEVKKIVVSA